MKLQLASSPLYQQVKDHIVGQIESGVRRTGDRVPSEHELVDRLGVSRMTVNRAIRELTAEGWLTRVQGVGTFVAEARPQSALIEVRSIAEEIVERGGEHGARVILAAAEKADADTAYAMGIRYDAEIFHVVLVHSENGRPVQVEDRYVNPSVAPRFLEQDFTRITPSEYLLREVPLTEMEHVIEAKPPSGRERRLLDMEPGEPCLILTRRTWAHGAVVTRVRLSHPGASYRLGSRFSPPEAPVRRRA